MSASKPGKNAPVGASSLQFRLPAIRFEPEAFQLSSTKIMGRQSAGLSFLKAAVSASRDAGLAAFGPRRSSGEAFVQIVRDLDPRVRPYWLSSNDLSSFGRLGGLHLPDPTIGQHARLRVRAGSNAYSITGVTHTISSANVVSMLSDISVAPVMPWDGLICTSRAVKSAVEKLFLNQEDYLKWKFRGTVKFVRPQMPVIPLGVHCADFDFSDASEAAARKALQIESNEIVFLFLGRLSFHAKAHPFQMYEALELAAKQTGKKITLLQCGWFANDFIEKTFKEGAQKFCPSIRTIWLDGRKEEARMSAWAASDIFLSLSDNIQETFGLTLIEAMAAAKPVIATDWNGYRDIVVEGDTGFLVRTFMPEATIGDDLAMAYATDTINYNRYIGLSSQLVSVDLRSLQKACIQLIENGELRKSMGRAGRLRAQSMFDWNVVMSSYRQFWSFLQDIRSRALSDNQPQLRGVTSEQLNPFRLFSSYPSAQISERMSVRLLAPAFPLDLLASEQLFALGREMIDKDISERIFSLLSSGSGLGLNELLSLVQAPRAKILANIAVLAKMNLLEFDEGT